MTNRLARIVVAGSTAAAIGLAGCGNSQPASTSTAETARVESAQEKPAEQSTSAQSTPATSSTAQAQTAAQISEADAKKVALEAASVAEKDVTNYRCTFDTDDGATVYEIEFNVGDTEYEFDIDATTGAILKQSFEAKDAKD